jgi:hypothetical protein
VLEYKEYFIRIDLLGIPKSSRDIQDFLDIKFRIFGQAVSKKLEHYGIRGIVQKWFESYLNNRKQIVKYNDVRSEEFTINSGVPQGSILGPFLFLLYINDIQYCSELISMVLFADDTSILHSRTCLKTLNEIIQTEINKITDWLNVNKLSINTKKQNLFYSNLQTNEQVMISNFQ